MNGRPGTGASSRRRAAFWAILVVITLGIPLLLGEAATRFMLDPPVDRFRAPETWARYDEVIGWAAKPGVYASTEPGNASITSWPNWRRATREQAEAKPDRPKLALVGDSWTMGYGIKDSETFAWRLDAANPDLAIENFGAGGYSTYQAYLMLRRAFEINGPRLKFVLFSLTSFMVSRDLSYYSHARSVRTLTSRKVYLPPLAVVGSDGRITVTPPIVTEKWPLEEELALVSALHNAFFWFYMRSREVSTKVDGQMTTNILRMADALAREHGARLTVLVLEDSPPVPTMLEALDREGIRSLNCSQRDGGTPEMRVGGDPRSHPNGRLNARFADCIQLRIADVAPR